MKTLLMISPFIFLSTAMAQPTTLSGPTDTVTIVNQTPWKSPQFEIGRFSRSHKLPANCPFPRYSSECLSVLTQGHFLTHHGYPVSYREPIQVTYDNSFLNLGIFVRIHGEKIFEISDCDGAMDKTKRYFISPYQKVTIDISQYDGVCIRSSNMVITLTAQPPEPVTTPEPKRSPPRNGI